MTTLTINEIAINLTENELKGLQGIVSSDYCGGPYMSSKSDYLCGVWTFSANTFENARSFSGVISSLVKKGLVISVEDSGHGENNAVLKLTETGWEAVVAVGMIKDAPTPDPVVWEDEKVEEKVEAPKAAPAPVAKTSGKIKFKVSGFDAEGKLLYSNIFVSNKRLNALINAEDYFKKQGVDLDSAHRIDIVPV